MAGKGFKYDSYLSDWVSLGAQHSCARTHLSVNSAASGQMGFVLFCYVVMVSPF